MNRPTALIRDALLAGLAWAASVTTVHLAMGMALILQLHMPPLTWFAVRSVLLEVPLALAFSLLFSPLMLLPRGRLLHMLALPAAWLVMEFKVAVDPTGLPLMWLAPPLVGLLLWAIGKRLARRRWWLPAVAVVVVQVLLLSGPVVRARATGELGQVASADKPEPPPGAPDVLMIVLDTVRAQSVSAYGYERKTTPNFDRIASEGVLFEHAMAPATWSLPAHGSIFSGKFPSVAGAHGEDRYLEDDEAYTLAEALSDAGYETRCFTANPHISESFGLTQGFDWTDQAWITGAGGRGFTFIYRFLDELGFAAEDKGGGQVVRNIERYLQERPRDGRPVFVFVNFLEAHFPFHQLPPEFRDAYGDHDLGEMAEASLLAFGAQFGRDIPPEKREAMREIMTDLYDGGVKYSDALMGRVLDAWAKRQGLDDTLIIVLGDHGEMVGEHGAYGHNTSVYEQALHVPFAIRYPKAIPAGTRVDEVVSTAGIYATVMDLLRFRPPEGLQVGSLMPAILEGDPQAGKPPIAERFVEEQLAARFPDGRANGEGPLLDPHARYRVYREGSLKLAISSTTGPHLFDLATDPGEMHDLAQERPDEVKRLLGDLAAWEQRLHMPAFGAAVGGNKEAPAGNAAAMEQLKALGYVE